jgi:hypothetical protein
LEGEDYILRIHIFCVITDRHPSDQIQEEGDRSGIRHICGDEIYTGSTWEHLKERDYLKDLDVAKMVILKCLLGK